VDAWTEAGIVVDDQAFAVGGQAHYPGGRAVVGIKAGVMSLDPCTSGRFCVLTQIGCLGTMGYWTGDSSICAVAGDVGSARNSRTKAVRVDSASGASLTCDGPGAQNNSASSTLRGAGSVNLSSTTSC
jgi:hypothetical protein